MTMRIALAACLGLSFYSSTLAQDRNPGTWDSHAAAAYLDGRAEWWSGWPSAARDHGTFCVSCHTALPYALARPALRGALGETGASPAERKILDNVAKRVTLWNDVQPFYSDEKQGPPKSMESRGTESVLNALIEVSTGEKPSALAREALDHMRALQLKTGDAKGAWPWLNFHNEPWEADDSQYWGATLAAIAAGNAPAEYRARADVKQSIEALRGYLLRQEPAQSLLNRVGLLWASTRLPGLLSTDQQQSIVRELWSQQREDGGWSASSLVPATWKRKDSTPLETKSDGYATGLLSFVVRQSGVPRSEARMEKA